MWRLALLFSGAQLLAAELAEEALRILERNCLSCHSRQLALSGLDLSSREGALKGGTRGAAVRPGDVHSLLLQAVRQESKLAMPPGKKLPSDEIETLRRWVESGALWPRQNSAPGQPVWWSFRKVVRPAVPQSANPWVRNAIDAFVLAKLTEKGLKPSSPADGATLVRRLYFDLLGLPPTREQIDEYLRDQRPDAWERLVDKLLSSPHYGEKWGRHWLDLVRYADTAGFELDPYIADAWRYRDYVIASFNADKPYDRFIREQLAGDEFWPEDPESVMGTGFFCVGPNRDYYPDQADINRVETLTDYTDTTGSVFMGLTLGCARCHDHKYDPIPQRDYYRLQAIFAPAVKTRIALNRLGSLGYDVAANSREIKLQNIGEEIGAIQHRCRSKIYAQKMSLLRPEVQQALQTEDEKRTPAQKALATENAAKVAVSDAEIRACLTPEESERLRAIEVRLVSLFASYRPKPFACGVNDVGNHAPPTFMPVRGELLGVRVEPGFLTVLGGGEVGPGVDHREATGPIPLGPTTYRRKSLAEWITQPDHPLTARVMVNRIWHYHFGRGIVSTTSDFGSKGALPTHPELLDWLASEFVARKWSVKEMHRLILTSATWKQSSQITAEHRQKDPQNQWLSRFSRRRLSAEELRDSVLFATGNLNRKAGGRPVVTPLSKEETFGMIGRMEDSWIVHFDPSEYRRRSIYLMQKRTFRLPMLEVYDAPESMLSCPRRDSSTTAPQALTMLNGAFVMEQGARFARQLVSLEQTEAIRRAWRSILLREPQADELANARQFLVRQLETTGNDEAALVELVRGLLNSNEFLYVD
ncbi:MAG: PSD1 and planctomycete cytochrome C domain-containing protein [Bryobacteraceae bacterium]|nr:PSD1 and planctomycete cytochrome C domain-containing protein [Bryobacteraceae bacterium]MDW8380360.1 PSD1 and planctomycete cytochrome C domain-containing protein [Bryobacterales bacterium]